MAGVVRGHREVARVLASSFELIVCDDGSTDGTWELVKQLAQTNPVIVAHEQSFEPFTESIRRVYSMPTVNMQKMATGGADSMPTRFMFNPRAPSSPM